VDPVPEGFSAVYTFYQPRERRRGLGTYALLQQILAARELGLDYVYLGYWVAGSETMDYKRHFRPLQLLSPAGWALLDEETAAADRA
jgi:leucyl-tRNA---protein transferase